MFMVSYDVASLFTNIPLSETIDLAVNAIFESNTGLDLKLSKTELKELFNFAISWNSLAAGESIQEKSRGGL